MCCPAKCLRAPAEDCQISRKPFAALRQQTCLARGSLPSPLEGRDRSPAPTRRRPASGGKTSASSSLTFHERLLAHDQSDRPSHLLPPVRLANKLPLASSRQPVELGLAVVFARAPIRGHPA